MQYANLADIVNGFDYAQAWQFIRKGKNDWSLVGINDQGKVVYEVEHLFFGQLLKLCVQVDAEAPIQEITDPQTMIRRESVIKVLNNCLAFIKGDVSRKDEAKKSVETLLREMTPQTTENDGDETQIRGTGGRSKNRDAAD